MTDRESIEVSRLLPAPIEEVFSWWTEVDLLKRWMSPVGSVDATVDLRVGGSFRIVMNDAAMEIDHAGEYLEIDRPRRLVFSWRSRYTDGVSLVTVSFEPVDVSSTRVSILHSGLPAPVAGDHGSGWGAMTDRLAAELRAGQ